MKSKFLIYLVIGFFNVGIANSQNLWVSQSSGTSEFLTSVFFITADTGYVCSEGGKILKTTNGGNNWNQVGVGPGYCLYFLNSKKGFGYREDQLLSTQNGGITWDTCYSNPDILLFQGINFPDKKHGYATAWDQTVNNLIVKTNNGGITWDTVYRYADYINLFTSIFFTDSLHGFAASDHGYIFKTTNGGYSWSKKNVDSIVQPSFNSIYFINSLTGYLAGSSIYKTTDAGSTWTPLTCPGEPFYSIYFVDAMHGCVGGGNGINSMSLYQTNDGGNTWYQGLNGIQVLNSVFFPDTVPGYAVGSNGTILKYQQTVSINENSLSEGIIQIYPNPATSILYIDGVDNAAVAEIYDISGKLLFKKQLINSQVDISGLDKGMYFIRLTTQEGGVVRKFIKE
jgi:photosystem II stability/assembly factor-like uncharacterized protein